MKYDFLYTGKKKVNWALKRAVFDNTASFDCIIHVFILVSKRNKRFFGVAVRFYLFINMSLSSEQQNTGKVLCLQSEFCLHSDGCGERGHHRAASKLA